MAKDCFSLPLVDGKVTLIQSEGQHVQCTAISKISAKRHCVVDTTSWHLASTQPSLGSTSCFKSGDSLFQKDQVSPEYPTSCSIIRYIGHFTLNHLTIMRYIQVNQRLHKREWDSKNGIREAQKGVDGGRYLEDHSMFE